MRASLQRRCACGGTPGPDGECAACKARRLQRQLRQGGPSTAPPIVHDVLRSPGRALEPAVRGEMEGRFGHDFSRVRVHADAAAEASATALGARAYAVGTDVVFGADGYRPESRAGRRLLAHELAHVVQQRSHASARPMPSSVSGLDDPLEEEAERAGAAFENGEPVEVEKRAGEAGTVYRVPLPPGVDILPPLEGIRRVASALTASCEHSAALTWADFTGPPQARSRFSAETHFHFELGNADGQQIVRAIFDAGPSWVKARWANAGDRTQNGCAAKVTACQRHFDQAARRRLVNVTFGPLGLPRGCAATAAPDQSVIATSRDECNDPYGAECDRVAQLESERLLQHEQGHYDLACALARTGTLEILGGGAPAAALAGVRRAATAQTRLYDTQSAHGCNPAAQATWESDIRDGLPAVDITAAAAPPRRRR